MGIQLKSSEFRREREGQWLVLEALVQQVEQQGLRRLDAEDLAKLVLLYRAALSSLSVARSISLDRNLLAYLEGLTARAYFVVYGTQPSAREPVAHFFAVRFPSAVRRFRWHLLAATLLFALGVLAAWGLVARDMDRYYTFVPSYYSQGRVPSAPTDSLRHWLENEKSIPSATLGTFASMLFVHNAGIGMLCFALGFAAGLPVFWLVFTNGLILGAFGALYHSRGLDAEFWSWVLPHGITEILAVLLCAAAGLALGQSLVFPGHSARLVNLARRGARGGSPGARRRGPVLRRGTDRRHFPAAGAESVRAVRGGGRNDSVLDRVFRVLAAPAGGIAEKGFAMSAGAAAGRAGGAWRPWLGRRPPAAGGDAGGRAAHPRHFPGRRPARRVSSSILRSLGVSSWCSTWLEAWRCEIGSCIPGPGRSRSTFPSWSRTSTSRGWSIDGVGVTLGKRALRIRVADVTGGALTGEAVVARNLTRNFELVLPLQGLAFMSLALPDVSGWLWLLGSVWLVAFGLMPLFNRDRRRVGDLVAGTMVVDMPRVVLLEDLGARGRSRGDAESEFEFSAEQLDLYGAYELQVLEDLLRLGYDADPRALEEVCTRIKRKIGWDRKRWDVNTRRFLMAFYKAQRQRLEQKLLLGHHRERKRS